jgi:glutathione reductase (NADPH)
VVYASRYADDFVDAAGYGWTVTPPTFHWPTLIANKDAEIARLERAYVTTLERAGATLERQRAVLEDAHTVRLADGKRVTAKFILIATGGGATLGNDIAGIEHVISSKEAFDLPELPKSILIQGGGYVALEFAGIFAGLGSKVTLALSRREYLRGSTTTCANICAPSWAFGHRGSDRQDGTWRWSKAPRVITPSCRTARASKPIA